MFPRRKRKLRRSEGNRRSLRLERLESRFLLNGDSEITVAVTPLSVSEDGSTNLVFTFTRTEPTAGTLVVSVPVGGTATLSDYAVAGFTMFTGTLGTVTFAAGSATATVTVDPTGDTAVEPDETVVLSLEAGIGYTIGSPSAATGTILNDDTEVTVAVSPVLAAEDGAANLVYTFTRSGLTADALTASFTVEGAAAFGTDYAQTGASSFTATTGSVTFAAGSPTATVIVDPAADTAVEPDEMVVLTVTGGSGYTAGSPASAMGTILNDDTEVAVSVEPASVAEDGAVGLNYRFTRTGLFSSALTVDFSVGGTAALGSDYTPYGAASYTATTGSITIPAGSPWADLALDPAQDTSVEPDETVVLTVVPGSGYFAGSPAAATGTILNDEVEVSVSVSPASVAEDGSANLVYTFTRTGPTDSTLTVSVPVGGTATLSDYAIAGFSMFTGTLGTVTFAAGSAMATVTVDPTDDTAVEPDETVVLSLEAGGYTIGASASATGTILNDDTEVTVAVAPVSAAEDGAANLLYTFTRSGLAADVLTVAFTVGGTAAFGTDYAQAGAASFTATTGSVAFAAGSSTATVTVDPAADAVAETDETVVLTVGAGSGYTAGTPATATGTIANDDTEVTVTVSPASAAEDGAANLLYTFTRIGRTGPALTVNFSVGGTAAYNTDFAQTGAASFTATTGSVTFAAGISTATVTINPNADATAELDETVLLTVSAGSGYTAGSPSSATGTILNDETEITVSASPTSVAEDGTASLVYTFTRSGLTAGALTISFNVSGSATFNTDYTQTGAATFSTTAGTVTFAAGSNTAAVTIDPASDAAIEDDESIVLALTAGTGYLLGSPSTASATVADDDGLGSISGYVFCDGNGDGIPGSDEFRIPLVTLTLQRQENGNWADYTTTPHQQSNSSGWYEFSNLPSGKYRVVETQPAVFLEGGSNEIGVDLAANSDRTDVHFVEGFLKPEYISKRLFLAHSPPLAEFVCDCNQAPVVDPNGAQAGADYTAKFTPGQGAIKIVASDAAIADSDSATLTSLRVTITNRLDGADELLDVPDAALVGRSITKAYVDGALTLSGVDRTADYQAVLREVTFNNQAASPQPDDRLLSVVAFDGHRSSGEARITIKDPPPSIATQLAALALQSPQTAQQGRQVELAVDAVLEAGNLN